MHDLEYYMNKPYTIKLQNYPDEGWFVQVKELPGCVGQGDTAEQALAMIQAAMESWLEVSLEDGDQIPEPYIIGQPQNDYALRSELGNRHIPWSYLSVPEAAEASGISARTVGWAASHGKIAGATKIRGTWRFPQAAFLSWAETHEKRGKQDERQGTH